MVNYAGRPFTQDIHENLKLKRMVIFMFAVAMVIIFDLSEELRNGLELVPFPDREF